MTNPLIENVRRSLRRSGAAPSTRMPEVYPRRQAGSSEAEIEAFLTEVKKLQGKAEKLSPAGIPASLAALVVEQKIKRAALWNTPRLKQLDIAGQLRGLGVELASPEADKYTLASCDLGVTEADFLLPETGTVVLRSSEDKPRAVSLLPPVHLVIASPAALRPDLHQVFAEAKGEPYLVFITGPSRTADIELVTTLGVHGPKYLYVWVVME